MADATLVDLVKITALTTGTGAVTLGDAVPGYRGREALLDGAVYNYTIQQEAEYELGRCTYLLADRQIVRTPLYSSNGGQPINLQANVAIAFVATADDILGRDVLRPIYGTGAPDNSVGVTGQVYFDLEEPVTLWGPKTTSGWSIAAVLQGGNGKDGATGPANSTYRSLTELKAAPQANGSYTLLTATGRAEYAFVAGNFTGRADDQAVVKLDSVPLTTGALVRATDPLAYKYGDTMRGNRGGRGSFYGQTTILLIGDSIGQAYAIDGTPSLPSAANYRLGYSWIVGRSVMNAAHQGYPETQGPGYHTILNAADAFKAYGYDGNGSFAATGVWGSRTRFSSGQYIAQTGVEANYGDVFYDATASSGSLVYKLNGVTVATIPITGSGIKSTIFTQIKPTGHLTALTDTFRVEAQGGAVEIVSPIVAKHSPGPAPFVFVGATSGYSYTDYNTSAAMDEMATYLNFVSSDRRVLVCCIGTNSLYNNDKKVSPTGMVAQMEQLYAGMKTRVANFSMLVSVPPLSDTTKFPLLVPGFTREDYALAILSWAASRDVSVMRHDLADISLADGLHPDIAGHRTYADVVLEALGVPFDPFMKDSPALDTDYLRYIRTDTKIAYNNTWVDFNADFTVYASRLSGRVQLSGAIKGGSAASIGTLPAGFRPNIRDRKLPVVFNPDTTPSVGMVNITPAGILSVIGASVPGSIDLSGVSFDVDPAL